MSACTDTVRRGVRHRKLKKKKFLSYLDEMEKKMSEFHKTELFYFNDNKPNRLRRIIPRYSERALRIRNWVLGISNTGISLNIESCQRLLVFFSIS